LRYICLFNAGLAVYGISYDSKMKLEHVAHQIK